MRRFEFRLIPLTATAIGMAVFLRLGWWQWTKAEQVEAQVQAVQARAHLPPQPLGGALVQPDGIAHMPITVRGEYEAQDQFLLDNQQENGQPGVHVITPLRIEGSSTRVLVNRGWIGWGASRAVLPRAEPPPGPVEVHGIAHIPLTKKRRWVSEDAGTSAELQTRLDLDHYRASVHHPVQPIVVLQDADDANDGLVRHWPPPEDKTLMHRGYALQWLLITLVLVVFFLVGSRRQTDA